MIISFFSFDFLKEIKKNLKLNSFFNLIWQSYNKKRQNY